MNSQEIARIRTKLEAFPPYDWEDDVEALLNHLERAQADRDEYLANFTAELEGGREMRLRMGARNGETLFGCMERLIANLVDAERRADAHYRVYQLTEKYHNEDLVWMEKIIAAANSVVSGPDSQNHARLADVLDEYEKWRKNGTSKAVVSAEGIEPPSDV